MCRCAILSTLREIRSKALRKDLMHAATGFGMSRCNVSKVVVHGRIQECARITEIVKIESREGGEKLSGDSAISFAQKFMKMHLRVHLGFRES